MPCKKVCRTACDASPDKVVESEFPSRSDSKDSIALDSTRAPSRADPNSEPEDDELLDMRMLPCISERRGSEMMCSLEAELAVRLALERSLQPQCLIADDESARTMVPRSCGTWSPSIEVDVAQQACEKCNHNAFVTKACREVAAIIACSCDKMKLVMVVLLLLVLARVLRLSGLLTTNPVDMLLVAFPLGGLVRYAMIHETHSKDQKHTQRFNDCKRCRQCNGESCCLCSDCPYGACFWADLPKSEAAGDDVLAVNHSSVWAEEFLLRDSHDG
jgi:hypothetical protein